MSFYIGYLPKAPDDLRRFLRRLIGSFGAAALVLASVLVLAQQRFTPALFEFTKIREFSGTLEIHPYPSLHTESNQRYLLVGTGKYGFSAPAGLNGRPVHLRAKLIYRSEGAMLEVMPNTLTMGKEASKTTRVSPVDAEEQTLSGEIIDTKCFLGAMNPGRSKVHRDCAARCISGGIPPALLVTNGAESELLLLEDLAGGPIPPADIQKYIGERVKLHGIVTRTGNTATIKVLDVQR